MNHIYRVIWNRVRNAFMVVAETACSKSHKPSAGRSGGVEPSRGVFVLTALTASLFVHSVQAAGVEVASGNTQVYNSPNGVQVIDIATANSGGVSHNRYVHYNIDNKGQVLNNNSALTGAGALQSQLAGQLVPNVNLTKEARVILNEVVAPNRSSLNGYAEVVGGKADVVVANPYGITCSGCGFINTDRATLTTGTPVLSGNGAIEGFAVRQGDISVEGTGVDGRNQQMLDLVARQVSVAGQINAQDLTIAAGTQDYSYADRSSTAVAVASDAPLYAIDSSMLGGMYANRIQLVATEAGVGVRMRGEAAATGSDFVLSASGKIEIASQISAERDIALTSSQSGAAIELASSEAQLSSKRDLSLTAQNGALALGQATLTAGRDLSVSAQSLADISNGAKRYAAGDTTVNTTAASEINGSAWGAGDALSITAASVTLDQGANLYSGAAAQSTDKSLSLRSNSGHLQLNSATVQSGGAVNLNSAADLTLGSTTEVKSSGASSVTAAGTLNNNGTLASGANLTLNAANLTNTKALHAAAELTATVTGNINNSSTGQISAHNDLTLEAAGELHNQGSVVSSDNLTLNAASLTNTKVLHAGSNLNATVADNASNSSTGQISAHDTLDLEVTGELQNHGTVVSSKDLSISAASLTNTQVLHAGRNLTAVADSITNSNVGGISALNTLDLEATEDLQNAGALYAGSLMQLSAGETLQNQSTGTIDSNGSVTTNSADFINNGSVITQGNLTITATNSFTNETLVNGASLSKRDGTGSFVEISNEQIANEGGITNEKGFNAWFIAENYGYSEELVGLTLEQLQNLSKAKLISGSGSTLTINYGNSGLNKAGVISAPTVNISGTGTFRNEEFTLYSYNKEIRWIRIADEGPGDDYFTAWARVNPEVSCYVGAPAGCSGRDENIPNSPDNDNLSGQHWNPGTGWIKTSHRWSSDGFPDEIVREARALAAGGGALSNASVIGRSGAGIFASSLNFSGGTLENAGSPWPDDTSKLGQAAQAPVPGASAPGTSVPGTSVPGVNTNISLPTNPNGYFVPSKDPAARYLVETNPLFNVGANFVGSDYLADRFGFNPDTVQTRLGDANYEAHLMREQLISLTGGNLLAGFENEADQMQALMDQAYNQGQKLGLTFGQAPTPEQLAALTEDIVWMEETEVNGQKVLVPRVYLAPETVAALESGAVIAARDLSIEGDGFTNTGGTVSGSDNLSIKTTGDITNTSGTIKGGNVALTSTEGSVRNQTLAISQGDDFSGSTAIGKTAGIESTNNLNIKAAENIEVIGANLSAGGNASLDAGNEIVVDTIVDKNAITRSSADGANSVSVRSETNIGSQINIGNNLSTKSGGDTTIAGSAVSVGGDLDADAGGSFNVLARQDKLTVETRTEESGVGVGGGLYGTQVTTTSDFTGTNVGSTLEVGGNAKVKADQAIVLQGSDVTIAGDADLEGKEGIAILDGLDEKRSSTVVETITFLKMDKEGEASASAGAEASAGEGEAAASAEAKAKASGSADLKLMEASVSAQTSGSKSSVASNLNVGGNLGMKSDGAVTVQGSNVASGGDLSVDAKDLNVLTGRNEEWSSSDTRTVSVGLFTEGEAEAKASAEAGASAQGNAGASAEARANASGTATAGIRTERETESSYNLTNSASTLSSGGNMQLTVKDTATFQGAEVSSGGDMSIDAGDIKNIAAQDISIETKSSERHTLGVYVGAEAGAGASAEAGVDAQKGEAGASAEVGANVEVSAGLRQASETSSSTNVDVKQVTNSFTSGGNFSRTAKDTIVDQGTQVTAAGDLSQSAREIRDEAVSDMSFSSESEHSHDVRVGAYAGAGASASTDGGADAGAAVGMKASAEVEMKKKSSETTTAVTSGFTAGGSINSKSTDGTTLVGTQFNAGKDINIDAGSLEYRAAQDTHKESSNELAASAAVSGGVGTVDAELELELEMAKAQSTTARTGSMGAGGNINIRTTGDAHFEGTELSSDGDINLDSGGDVTFEAARNTESSSGLSVELGLGASKAGEDKSKSVELGLGVSHEQANEAVTGSLSSGGNIKVRSGGNTSLEGVDVAADGDVEFDADGKVIMKAAKSTSSSFGLDLGASASKETVEGETSSESGAGVSVEGGVSQSREATTIQSGGRTSIKQGQ